MNGGILSNSRTRAAMLMRRGRSIYQSADACEDERCAINRPGDRSSMEEEATYLARFLDGVSRDESGNRSSYGGGRPRSSVTISGTLPGH